MPEPGARESTGRPILVDQLTGEGRLSRLITTGITEETKENPKLEIGNWKVGKSEIGGWIP